MNILYVVSRPLEINSSASQRNLNTVNAMALLGHKVTVITAEPSKSHPQYSTIKLENDIKQIYIPAGTVKKLSAKAGSNFIFKKIKGILYRAYNNRSIYDTWKNILNSHLWNEMEYSDFDVLISSADPKSSHLVGELIHGKTDLPWIQIWGDPFTGDITSSGMERQKQQEEYRLLGKCDKVVFLSELTSLEMKEKYKEYAEKIFFMPRPYIKESIFSLPEIHKKPLKLSYCGDYNSLVRSIEPLYNAMLHGEDCISICGNSDLNLVGNERIRISARIAADKVKEIEDAADILVHLSNKSGTQIPGKIYNYAATNKPILFILDGECEKIKKCFEKKGYFYFCRNNENDIRNAIEEIRDGKNFSKLEPVREFSMEKVIGQLLQIKNNTEVTECTAVKKIHI